MVKKKQGAQMNALPASLLSSSVIPVVWESLDSGPAAGGALCFQYEWLRTANMRALLTGSLALGANVLTRLTTALDIAAVGLFILLILRIENVRGRELLARLWEYIRVVAPCYAVFVLIDRLYQYLRFGSLWNTYLSVLAEQQRKLDPCLPANFPWSTPLHTGFLGPLITREKSLFLYEPLVLLTILLD